MPTVIGNGALHITRGNAFKNVLPDSSDGFRHVSGAVVSHELFQPGGEERVDECVGCSAVYRHREDRFVRAEACRQQGGCGCYERTESPFGDAAGPLRRLRGSWS